MFNLNFKNNKKLVLKTLMELVKESIDNADINVDLEQDVAELLTEIKDKRRLRKLKSLKKELNDWIVELK